MMNSVQLPSQMQLMRNRYEVRGLLGVGSYGRVWAAYDRVLKKLVAVKRINKLFSDLTDCKRILREICILNRLPNHNNIVKLLDCFIDEEQTIENFDTLYLVMDISDSDLRKILKQNVYLTEMHVLTLMYHLLCGILYLHSAGIYHRDLKPANCLVNQNCTVKICDLGLARTVADRKAKEETDLPLKENRQRALKNQLTSHVVTRWYRAPELILLQPNYDEKIDVWSIGCIFGELLGMIQQNCSNYHLRVPLFPGKRCFPLSPMARENDTRGLNARPKKDQLSYIFDLLGTPSAEDIKMLEREDARAYVRLFHPRTTVNLQEKYPAASSATVDLLSKMLVFNPTKRISVIDALLHPALDSVRDEHDFLVAREKMVLPFDETKRLSEQELRMWLAAEARKFSGEDLRCSNSPFAKSTFSNALSTTECEFDTDLASIDELSSKEYKQQPYHGRSKPVLREVVCHRCRVRGERCGGHAPVAQPESALLQRCAPGSAYQSRV